MAELGRKGGAKSIAKVNAMFTTAKRKRAGKKAAAALTPEERTERAKKAAKARWGKKKRGKPKSED
jgi:general stress protein YciG